MQSVLVDVQFRIGHAAKLVAQLKKETLDILKSKEADYHRKDFIWNYLLASFATMQSSRGYVGLFESGLVNSLAFPKLSNLDEEDRASTIYRVLKLASVRHPNRKSLQLSKCVDQIKKYGGLAKTKQRLEECIGTNAKIEFLKGFAGIGDKYARNMMMDVYHVEFRDSIAVDSRLESLLSEWNISFSGYHQAEQFFSRNRQFCWA